MSQGDEEAPISVFKPKFHTQEILEELRICFDKGWTGLGFKTTEFEKKWEHNFQQITGQVKLFIEFYESWKQYLNYNI